MVATTDRRPASSAPADPRPTDAPAPGAAALDVRGVVKTFGEIRALDGLDLAVTPGQTFGLLGPNGAGKSTLMGVLTGTVVATSGTVEVLGMAMPGQGRAVRARTGLVPQADNLDDQLTCAQNLALYARLYGLARTARDPAVSRGLAFARLADRADSLAADLSGGMRRRLLIARALLHDPAVVLMDEPTVGLDPQIRQEVWTQVDAIRGSGATTVLTTHYIEEAERLCDEVAIIDHGRLLARAAPERLVADHVRSEVVVEVHGDAALRGRVAAAADDAGVAHRSAGTSVAVFTDDVVTALGGRAPLEEDDLAVRLHRPANLEDVFVALTGELLA